MSGEKRQSTNSGTRDVIPEKKPYFTVTRNEDKIQSPQPEKPSSVKIKRVERIEEDARHSERLQDALLRGDEKLRRQLDEAAIGSTSQPYGRSSSGSGGGYGSHSHHGSQSGSYQGQRGNPPRGGNYQPPGPGGGY